MKAIRRQLGGVCAECVDKCGFQMVCPCLLSSVSVLKIAINILWILSSCKHDFFIIKKGIVGVT